MLSFNNVFYFLFGVCSTLYFVVLFTSKNSKSKTGDGNDVRRFYVNLFFINRKEVVENLIRSKVPRTRPVIRALAKRLAVQLLHDGIVEKIGSGLCTQIPERLGLIGVQSTVSIGYTRAAYICFDVALIDVDLYKLIEVNAGEEKAQAISTLLDKLSIFSLDVLLKKIVLYLLHKKLATQIPVQIRDKLEHKFSTDIELIVCSEEEQGTFLVQTIQQLNSEEVLDK
jgi:hypothetical protein